MPRPHRMPRGRRDGRRRCASRRRCRRAPRPSAGVPRRSDCAASSAGCHPRPTTNSAASAAASAASSSAATWWSASNARTVRRPGSEVLGRDLVAAGRLAQVVVDVLGSNGPRLAVFVDVLEQVLPGQLLAAPDERREAPVDQLALLGPAALAPKPEPNGRARHLRVPVAQRRDPERAIEARVLRVADAQARHLEERDDGREDLLARQAGPAKVLPDAAPDPRKQLGEADEARELAAVASGAETGVVAVLAPASCVPPDRLDVPIRARADPDVRPGRRDRRSRGCGRAREPTGSAGRPPRCR